MKKIVLLDPSVATINMGDEIIKTSILDNFNEILKDNYICNLPTHTKTFSWLQKFLYKDRMNIYNNADFKFFCGTNALYVNMLRPMPTWNINMFNYSLFKNTILLGVGLGVNGDRVNTYTRFLYNKVLSKKYIHSVRDEKTKLFLENMGFKVLNTGCPTLWGLDSQHCQKIPSKKSDNVIFTLTGYESDIVNDQAMIDILNKNYKKVYFWPQSVEDLNYLKSLDNVNSITIVSPNLVSYKRILETDIDYIGNRLHGGIFAMQNYCRSIIISIDYRASEMSKDYSFKCIPRNMVKNNLENIINSEWSTLITGLNFDKINKWKTQF